LLGNGADNIEHFADTFGLFSQAAHLPGADLHATGQGFDGVQRLNHALLAFQGNASRLLGQVGGGGRVPGDLFNGGGHLSDSSGCLFNLAMLLLQVPAAFGGHGIQFFGRCSQLVGGTGYLSQGLHQVIAHGLLCPEQAGGFVVARRVDRLGEITPGNGFGYVYRFNNGAGNASGQQPGHQYGATTHQQNHD